MWKTSRNTTQTEHNGMGVLDITRTEKVVELSFWCF
jgi:hypothetical protein